MAKKKEERLPPRPKKGDDEYDDDFDDYEWLQDESERKR